MQTRPNQKQLPQTFLPQKSSDKSQDNMVKIKHSTKYYLNKPRLLKEFKNSKIFKSAHNLNNIRPYSQRFTYNQKTKYFQKENCTKIQTLYDIDYSILQKLNNLKHSERPKLVVLKKKPHKVQYQRTYNSSAALYPHNNSLMGVQLQQKYFTFLNKQGNQANSIKQTKKLTKFSSNPVKTCDKSFLQCFGNDSQNQKLKKYIRTNPINFNFLKTKKLSEKTDFSKSLQRSNKKKKAEQVLDEFAKSFTNREMLKQIGFLHSDQIKDDQLLKLKQQEALKALQHEIERFYKIISELNSLGYAEQKVNQWVWNYCENNKKFLQSIFFKMQGFKSSLAEHKLIYKLQDKQNSRNNLKKFRRTINNHEFPIQPEDISEMTVYLQQILVSKQYYELKRIQTQIEETSNAIKNNYLDMKDEKVDDILKLINTFEEKRKLKPIEYCETLNFYEDAKRLQTHFGNVKGLTYASRKKV